MHGPIFPTSSALSSTPRSRWLATIKIAGGGTITCKLQLTIPKALADAVGIQPNSKVVVTDHRNGTMTLRPATPKDLAELPYRGKRKEAA